MFINNIIIAANDLKLSIPYTGRSLRGIQSCSFIYKIKLWDSQIAPFTCLLVCVGYFPIQNLLKIFSNRSSVVTAPVISPR